MRTATVFRRRRARPRARWLAAPLVLSLVLSLACGAASAAPRASAAPASAPPWQGIGRQATPAELHAWDIDVRGDFKGLPAGSGSVDRGSAIWEAKCASCHGDFAESNAVFTPIAGGTSKKDIEAGRVYFMAHPGYPHRTTLMKVSKLSSLWDYINRAMPWNAPKSLSTDEVYAVLAYILSLGDIVPADFTLSNLNIAEVQKRMPNRDGHVFAQEMWQTRGKGDVVNPLCMKDCPVDGKIASSIPAAALNSNGNIAEQVRPFGEARGSDTSGNARSPAGTMASAGASQPAAASAAASTSASVPAADVTALLRANSCTACHAVAAKLVGPAFQDVARKYAGRSDAAAYLAMKIRQGGQGVWGPIPMPAQAQLSDADATTIAQWLAAGAK